MYFHFLSEQFYFSQESLITLLAITVAFITPWIVNYLNNRPKKSKLIFKKISAISQNGCLCVRLIIKNEGKFIAKSAKACLEEIKCNEKLREDFFSMPLIWTHTQSFRDIYPNQTVYLNLFEYFNNNVDFSVATGRGIPNLSKMDLGESELLIRIYQESGQVYSVRIKVIWDGKNVPKTLILNQSNLSHTLFY